MDNKVLDDIKKYATQRLQQAYGYAGVIDSAKYAGLNSGTEDETFTIEIKCEKDTD